MKGSGLQHNHSHHGKKDKEQNAEAGPKYKAQMNYLKPMDMGSTID